MLLHLAAHAADTAFGYDVAFVEQDHLVRDQVDLVQDVAGDHQVAAGLRLFLDTADTSVWDRWLPTGIFHGVTTNPLLLERAGQRCTLDNLASLADRAASLGAREIHLQTWGEDSNGMVERGRRLAALATARLAVAVKVPGTGDGFRAARELEDEE